jgi:betaine-aldehyde dehydrogenase
MPRGANAPDVLSVATDGSGDPSQLPQLVGGRWEPAANGRFRDVIEPATGEILARIPDGDGTDLDAAMERASEAQPEWARRSVADRAGVLKELAGRVAGAAEDLALLDARDNGSPWTEMHADALKGAGAMRYVSGLGHELRGDTIPVGPDTLHYTQLQPWGVVGRITAFNHPTLFACGRLAPALMTGNAVIIKPSELAALGTLALAALAEDLIPPGVLSVLTGGPDLGKAMARHPALRRLSFTGSVATSLKIAEGCAASGVIKSVTYELGGKNPMIVFPDVDPDDAAHAAVRGMAFTRVQGQSCGSTSRLFIHHDLHDEVLDRVVELARGITIGNPVRRDVEMGAMIDIAARDRCLRIIERAQRDGAQLVLGGGIPEGDDFERGAFIEPTVLLEHSHDSELARTEVFGPVLSVYRWKDPDDVVRLANDVRYGLAAAIWTRDIGEALSMANQLDCGYVWINDVAIRYPAVPFGGWKDSGHGLEHGIEELFSFTRTKAVNVRLN